MYRWSDWDISACCQCSRWCLQWHAIVQSYKIFCDIQQYLATWCRLLSFAFSIWCGLCFYLCQTILHWMAFYVLICR